MSHLSISNSKMMTLKFLIKIPTFLLIIFCLQIFIGQPVPLPVDLHTIKESIEHGSDVIFFGDSTLTYSSVNDQSSMSTPEILWRLLPKAHVWAVPHPSTNMDVYDAFIEFMAHEKLHPKCVIIPINLRSFSLVWTLNPYMQLRDEKFISKFENTVWIKFYHPLGVFKFFEPPVSQYSYEHTKILYKKQNLGRIKDLYFDPLSSTNDREKRTKAQFILDYMYPLTVQNHTFQMMLKLVQHLKNSGIEPVFYITPIDIQTGSELIGDDFVKAITDHTQLIKSVMADHSINVLDLSTTLPAQYFIWKEASDQNPNEHLNISGRYFIAKSLVEMTSLKNYQ